MPKQKAPDVFEQGFNAAQASADREAPEFVIDLGDDAVETWLAGYDEANRQAGEVVGTEETRPDGGDPGEQITDGQEEFAPVVETPTPGPQLVPRRTMVRLEIDLDDHELAKLAQRLVANHRDATDVEAQAKEAREHFKGKLADLETEAMAMRMAVSTRRGWRDVEADEFLIFEGRKIVTKRADTGETIATRDASDDEVKASKIQAEIPGTTNEDNVRDFFDSCLTADPSDDLARAWEKGTAAFNRDKTLDHNPYEPDSLKAKRWASAFTAAKDSFASELSAAADAITGAMVEKSVTEGSKLCVKCGAKIAEPQYEAGEEEMCFKCFNA